MKPTSSDTPRTDAAKIHANSINTVKSPPSEFVVTADFACELEIELNNAAANYNLCHANLGREVVKCGELAAANKKLVDENRRMVEALKLFRDCTGSFGEVASNLVKSALETHKQLDAPAEPANADLSGAK